MKKILCLLLLSSFILGFMPSYVSAKGEKSVPISSKFEHIKTLLETDKEAILKEKYDYDDEELLEKLGKNIEALSQNIKENTEIQKAFSPYSLYTAILSIRPGLEEEAKKDFDQRFNPENLSEEEMEKALRLLIHKSYGMRAEKNPVPAFVSHTFVLKDDQLTFQKDYLEGLKKLCFEAMTADLSKEETFQDFNELIKEDTHGLISPFYSPEEIREKIQNPLSHLLVNTLYFKDNWREEFDKEDSEEKDFFGLDGKEKTTMMKSLQEEMFYLETEKYVAVKKPYNKGSYMLIVLPKDQKAKKSEIESYAKEARENEDFFRADVVLEMPKWECEDSLNLKEVLEKLDIRRFLDASTKVFETGDPFNLSGAKQKISVKVDEEGSEAAAVTVVEAVLTSMAANEPEIVHYVNANHPFAYAIMEGNIPLFEGTILNAPKK